MGTASTPCHTLLQGEACFKNSMLAAQNAPALILPTVTALGGVVPGSSEAFSSQVPIALHGGVPGFVTADAFPLEMPLRVYCSRCGKPYASNDGARKHCKRHHPQWLSEMDARREPVSQTTRPEKAEVPAPTKSKAAQHQGYASRNAAGISGRGDDGGGNDSGLIGAFDGRARQGGGSDGFNVSPVAVPGGGGSGVGDGLPAASLVLNSGDGSTGGGGVGSFVWAGVASTSASPSSLTPGLPLFVSPASSGAVGFESGQQQQQQQQLRQAHVLHQQLIHEQHHQNDSQVLQAPYQNSSIGPGTPRACGLPCSMPAATVQVQPMPIGPVVVAAAATGARPLACAQLVAAAEYEVAAAHCAAAGQTLAAAQYEAAAMHAAQAAYCALDAMDDT